MHTYSVSSHIMNIDMLGKMSTLFLPPLVA